MGANPSATLLKVENLETYYGKVVALREVSLELFEGEVVTVLGANGAGKTTLLKTIAGALRRKSGTIFYRGQRIDGLSAEQLVQKGLAMVPEGRRVFQSLTVHENLVMGGFTVRSRSELHEDIDRMYEMFPALREKRDHLAGSLSGGQQQMVAIGRALVSRPVLLLMDEPTLGLAPIFVKQVGQYVASIRDFMKTSVLLVEQNAVMATSVADRVYVMQTGRVVASGPAEEFQDHEALAAVYLGVRPHDKTSVATNQSENRLKGTGCST